MADLISLPRPPNCVPHKVTQHIFWGRMDLNLIPFVPNPYFGYWTAMDTEKIYWGATMIT